MGKITITFDCHRDYKFDSNHWEADQNGIDILVFADCPTCGRSVMRKITLEDMFNLLAGGEIK